MTRIPFLIALLFYGILITSCCSSAEHVEPSQTKWEIPLNVNLKMDDTTSVEVKELDLKFIVREEITGVNSYSICVNDERVWFYSYKDDIYTSSPGYGENSIILERNYYEVKVGKTDKWIYYPLVMYSMMYAHPDIPYYGVHLTHCEENSGVITGKIKLGADLPAYSWLKFTISEKGEKITLKNIVLER